jgi:uncharacterized RDD family membrane protein YckC
VAADIFVNALRDSTALTLSESEFYTSSKPAEQNSPQWRQEVALRVRAHRARRRRRTGQEGAMELQFDPPASAPTPIPDTVLEGYSAGWAAEPEAGAVRRRNADEVTTAETMLAQAPEGCTDVQSEAAEEILHSSGPARHSIDLSDAPIEAQVYEPLPPFPRGKPRSRERKVIEFPRLNESSIGSRDELAEPVSDQLRIFEAVEELSQLDPGPLAEIRLPSAEPEAVPTKSEFDLPLPVASCERRGLALVVDGIVVALGLASFLVPTFYLALPVTLSKPLVLAGAGLALILLSFYQSVFLFYSTATPGMRAAGLVLTDFSGRLPPRRIRLVRAFALVLSFAALCLGLIWMLIDEDRLGWHDRITRTYLRES